MGKRQNKSKEQIAQDMKNRGEIAEMKALAQNSILPVLIKHNQTAAQAVQVLEVMKQVALGKMNQAWVDKPFKEIGLAEELALDKTAESSEMYSEIITSFNEVPVAKVMKMLDVMSRVIDMYANRQVLQVRVGELPIDEMMK